ncbi:hydroxymethylbilane synthase [Anaerosolibacter carboniphilus]|uniref:Porphobilinogen deaminase n=1 Tax=Anaerosolibacter carboniphilus TaxID=1417629 RepID=A0A841KR78_9FIRM|nr:hydroxymethylbilane synthase [Anaerosolibacter carboniphilus]MBB6214590.1 hydroxymethylbilane synthase [Anaerosolibacter carboniphilus]
MKKNKIIVGSRASELALTQTRWVIQCLKEKFPHIDFEIAEIKTIGDKILDKTLNKIGGKGLFVKEIEAALLQDQIDMAVHSMKDVPTEMTKDLVIGAITTREDIRDVLISKDGLDIVNLPLGARIGTSSLRRAAQLLNFRPDLQIEPIRGNIATRIKKIEQLGLDGVILAAAGILRMGWEDQITEYISTDICIPAVGQGALGIQVRSKDQEIIDMIKEIDDPAVAFCVNAERSFMRELKGGCHVPIGAYAWIDGEKLRMKTVVAAPDGKEQIKQEETSHPRDGEMLGIKLAVKSLKEGAQEILTRIEAGE